MIVLVTGSAKGLGKAMIEHLAAQNYEVIIHYANSYAEATDLQESLLKQNKKAHILQADVSKYEEVICLFQEIEQNFGRLDVLINNVGNYLKKNIQFLTPQEWQYILDTNLNSTFFCCLEALKLMKKQNSGKIINIGFATIGQLNAQPSIAPYYIAKTGVLLLTKSLAKEYAAHNIQINMLSPGVLENSISQPLEEIPIGRTITFEEFNLALSFFLNEKNSYITGTNLEVAGGWRL